MKSSKLLITSFLLSAMIFSCSKTITECKTQCQNGGVVNQNCGCNCPSGYTGSNCETKIQPPIPDCERYGTAKMSFRNNSSHGYNYDVLLDGSYFISVPYRTVSNAYTIAAGNHTVVFKIAGTNTNSCSPAYPNLAVCSSHEISCSY